MEKKYSIGEFAKLTGMTERTLRHYDQIGLLKPSEYTEHGHRKYNNKSIAQLQKIVVLKFLDLSLVEISDHLEQPEQDFTKTLATQASMLEEKRKQIETVLQAIDSVQSTASGSEAIDHNSLLMVIHALKNEEARNRWISEHADDSVYNKLHSYTAPLDVDKEMATWTSKMKRFILEGKTPNDPEVIKHADAMVSMMKPIVEPHLDDEAREQLLNNEDSFEEPNPYLFPSAFNKEEEKFMKRVIDELISSKINLNRQDNR
ncbi:DNA-binding transcriptional MerR regulator [Cytobacillus eiseniae]|uniref:DNA-binding transcriptional MerR regulator n=1 Tax=Cytobacillus eiseniae TaxID=762947 RepID=A0ABS4RLR5_9BACI|nr:MerR family transcriptional regulator [Cytobacillus eiseniae]MBP2243300.1 DNA-binding transcriptional MerR regulator [Cytobacillus eiseniae]